MWFFTLLGVLLLIVVVVSLFVVWKQSVLKRCQLVYDRKISFRCLPFWKVWLGYKRFVSLQRRDVSELREEWGSLREWIFYQYQDGDMIELSRATDLAFFGFCEEFFAKAGPGAD